MAHGEKPLTEKQQFWLKHVEACTETGQTMRAYAEAHGLEVGLFYSSKTALRRKGVLGGQGPEESPLFHKARIVDGHGFGRCRIVLADSRVLEVDTGTDPSWVAALVRALAAR